MAEEEDDPVEHEIEVFLSKSLAENLYLLQYPVRPASVSYDEINNLAARVKPEQKKVELELAINTRSQNYARSKGEQVALNVDGASGKNGESNKIFNSDLMDKQILTSAPCATETGRYAVGVLKDGELHLTPLHAVVQLRPTFNYLDKADSKQPYAVMGEDDSEEEEEIEAKPVMMKFARPETDEAKARRMASYNYVHKKQEEESWFNLQYHSIDDSISDQERLMLYASTGDENSEFQLPPSNYLNLLMPPQTEKQEEKPAMPNNVLSLSQLRTMPLTDQIKTMLINVKVIRFSQLLAYLPQGTDLVAALRALQQVAVLVQGCWVVKSEVLYPQDAISAHSGISAEHLCRGRDYVMWRFTRSRHVVRKDISSVIKLPAEDVKDILEQMSRLRASEGWEFLFEYDKEYTDRYPDIVQRQKMLWDAKFQTLAKQLNLPKDADKKIKDTVSMEASPEKSKRHRRSSSKSSRKRTLSGRSVSDLSDFEMDVSKSDIICNHSGDNPEPMELSDGKSESLKDDMVNGSNPLTDLEVEVVKFCKETLESRYVVTLSELRRLLSLKLSQCSPGHILSKGVSDKMLEDSMCEYGAIKLNEQWPAAMRSEAVFATNKVGDHTDKWRGVLMDMFKKTSKVRTETFRKKLEEVLSTEVKAADCKKILKEYCTMKGNTWYVKGISNTDS